MTVPLRPDPAGSPAWMVGCSPSRTLVARRLDGDRAVLVKIYESGSPAEAARELALGQRLAGPGIAAHLEAGVDPETGKPCLVQELVPGRDLDALVDEHGALPANHAARIAAALAAVLARIAAHRDPGAPSGFVHADVKPGNVLVDGAAEAPHVVLLDLEHAVPAPGGAAAGGAATFTGGTHGFAPPEAYAGSWPTPAFDAFGLGGVLHVLLTGAPPFDAPGRGADAIAQAVRTGRRRHWLLDGCPAAVRAVVDGCLEPDPSRRLDAAEAERRLTTWLATEPAADDTPRLLALAGRPRAALDALPADAAERERARLARRARLLDRLSPPRVLEESLPIERAARELPRTLAELQAFLLRFPRHDGGRTALRAARATAARLAVELPERVAAWKRAGRHGEARAALDAAAAALARAGRLPRPPSAVGVRPKLAERDPLRVIALLRRDVDAAADAHEAVTARMRAAEASADPVAVEAAIAELAELYGGASPVVAASKDRLHRFDFYLARIGQQTALLDELEPLLDELGVSVDLEPVAAFRRDDGAHAPGRPRALLRAFEDLAREFPALAGRVAPAREALHRALGGATRRAWAIAADAEQKLDTPPIPIRPLAMLLARLDRLLQLDVAVDLPEHSRSELHDRVEVLRTRIEQARAERDRITRGAQEAMDRGHLTTAIYDMARAVDRFSSDAGEGPRLAEQFEAAKRRKQELEAALQQNHQLAARYGELAADPGSLPAERLAVLHEREHLLSFLCANLGPERAAAYADDLRNVQLDVLREQSADGDRRIVAARGSAERLSIAQRTFDALQHAAPEAGWSEHEAREARELTQHWLEILESCAEAARAAQRDRAPRRPLGRRRASIAAVLVAAGALAAIVLALRDRSGDPVATLRAALGEAVLITTGAERAPDFDTALSIARLRDFAAELKRLDEDQLVAAASECVAAIDRVDRGASGFVAVADAVDHFGRVAAESARGRLAPALNAFRHRALRAGFVTAAMREPSAELARRLQEDPQLRRALSAEDADALAHVLRD